MHNDIDAVDARVGGFGRDVELSGFDLCRHMKC